MLARCEENIFPGEDWDSGFVKISGGEKALFYYMFHCRNKSIANPPLLIWLDGGPGYSSAFGVWEHGGPFIVNNQTLGVERNPLAWNDFADTLFVDQPAGTLFSYTKKESGFCVSEACVTKDFYEFLLGLREIHPELHFDRLYLSGASYGGHYVPAIASYLMNANNPLFVLHGVATYNGLTDMYTQMASCPRYMYDNGLVGPALYMATQAATLFCQVTIKFQIPTFARPCAMLLFAVFYFFGGDRDPYDIQIKYAANPYEVGLTQYLNKPFVQRALGVNQKFVSTNSSVTEAMLSDYVVSLQPEMSSLLQRGINVTLVFGDKDYICNWIGGEWLANELEWAGQAEFLKESFQDWQLGGVPVAKVRRHEQLRLVVVRGAGHSVNARQRAMGREILRTLVEGGGQ